MSFGQNNPGVGEQSKGINGFLNDSNTQFFGLLAIFIIVGLTIVVYMGMVNQFLVGSKWDHAGFDIVIVIDEQIIKLIGYLALGLLFYLVFRLYSRYYALNTTPVFIRNVILIFILILSGNDLIKLLGFKLMGRPEAVALSMPQVLTQLKGFKDFATGLELLVPFNSGFLYHLLGSVNLFSVAGFYFLSKQTAALFAKKTGWLLILIVIYLCVASLFSSLTIIHMVSWTD